MKHMKHMGSNIGLVHYRRHFLLPSDWIDVCRQNAVDVILPVPLYVNPSVSENYRERHVAADWDYLMGYFKKNLPDEYDDIVSILGGNLYSPCNMIIARREALDDLCSWMFPIIFDVYKHGEEMGLDRTLLSTFLFYNKQLSGIDMAVSENVDRDEAEFPVVERRL